MTPDPPPPKTITLTLRLVQDPTRGPRRDWSGRVAVGLKLLLRACGLRCEAIRFDEVLRSVEVEEARK